nr:nucleotidyltransferase [uncultured Friedmanniella sp.]
MAVDIVPEDPTYESAALRRALKRCASALKRDGVPFALAGGYALWAHGAPEPEHDVDVAVAEADVEAAVESLRAEGFAIQRPPEDWLFKALTDDAMVDVLHRLQGIPVVPEFLATAEEQELLGLRIPVLPPTAIMVAKIRSLSEHYCDFTTLLPAVRALREQLDWMELRAAAADQPFAEAFLLLLDRLGISPIDA